jgi:hypothetical protein
MIFGQTRAIAFDLMQAAGEDADRARSLLDAAATTKISPPPPPVGPPAADPPSAPPER